MPAATPVTTPLAFTLAMLAALVLHAPPLPVWLMVIVAPAHILLAPLNVPAFGRPVTVITLVAVALPQLLVTL